MIENGLVLPTETPREYDNGGTEPEMCPYCDNAIDQASRFKPVVNAKGTFCSADCVSRYAWEHSTAEGKTALKRFVVALYLLSEENVTNLVPSLEELELDSVYPTKYSEGIQRASIENLRAHAAELLHQIDPDGDVDWAREAGDLAVLLHDTLGGTK